MWCHLSESVVCRMTGVTRATLLSWEQGHESWVAGRFRSDKDRQDVVERLADTYAALMWIAGGRCWPTVLEDDALLAAMKRMKTS